MDWHALSSVAVDLLAALLCLGGIFLSCLSFSGTWAVLLAAGLLAWFRHPGFPGVATLALFLVLCIAGEVIDTLAGSWGVKRRGGSKATGWAAMGGGMLGMLLGGLIPVPVLGPLLGMLVGSFGCAFWVEHAHMRKVDHAAHVAFGAVLARLGVIFVKLAITLAMVAVLFGGIALHR